MFVICRTARTGLCLIKRQAAIHIQEILVGFLKGGGIDFVHGVGPKLLDELEAVYNQRQIVRAEIFCVGKTVLVQVLNQFLRSSEARFGLLMAAIQYTSAAGSAPTRVKASRASGSPIPFAATVCGG